MATASSQGGKNIPQRKRDNLNHGGKEHREHRESSPARAGPKRKTSSELRLEDSTESLKQSVIRRIDEGEAKAQNDIKEAKEVMDTLTKMLKKATEVLEAAEENKVKWKQRRRKLGKVKKGDTEYRVTIERLMSRINLENLKALDPYIDSQREKRDELLLKKKSEPLNAEENKLLEDITKKIKEHEDNKDFTEEFLRMIKNK